MLAVNMKKYVVDCEMKRFPQRLFRILSMKYEHKKNNMKMH